MDAKVLDVKNQLSIAELTVLSLVDKKYKYIARDEDGTLWLFRREPIQMKYRPIKNGDVITTWNCSNGEYEFTEEEFELIREDEMFYDFNAFKDKFKAIKWDAEKVLRIDDVIERG